MAGVSGAQPASVGAQGVGQHVGVEPVVLVPGRAVAAAEVLELIGADHDHGQAGGQQGVDHRAVAAFDGDLADTGLAQATGQCGQAGGGVLDSEPADHCAGGVQHAHDMIGAGPVDPGGDPAGGAVGRDGVWAYCMSASSLLAEWGGTLVRVGTWLPVRSLIGARWRAALLTVGTSRVTAGSRGTPSGRRCIKRAGR